MELSKYAAELPRGGKKQLALKLGVTASYLSRLISGDRSITAERAIQIEDATDGAVSRDELRPDIQWEKSKRPKKSRPHLAPTLNQKILAQCHPQQEVDSAVQASSTYAKVKLDPPKALGI